MGAGGGYGGVAPGAPPGAGYGGYFGAPAGACFGISTFDPSTKMLCCRGNLFPISPQMDTCCGKHPASRQTSLCCSNDVFPKMPGFKCCDKRPYSMADQVCCDGEILPKIHPQFTQCCEKHAYNAETHECCQKDIMPRELAKYNLMCPSANQQTPPDNSQRGQEAQGMNPGPPPPGGRYDPAHRPHP